MILTIINFSLIFLIKSFFLNYFYYDSNLFHFPIEISSLIISSNKYLWSEHINWILLGWTGLPEEFSYLNKFDDYQWLYIFISWLISFFIYNIIYLIIERNKYNLYKLRINNFKFLLINYLSLYIWSLNVIINCTSNKYNFIETFISLLIIVSLSFLFPSLLMYLSYNHSNKEYFKDINRSYINKYYIFIELFFKNLVGIYIAFYYFWKTGNNYSLIVLNILLIIINSAKNHFRNKSRRKIYIFSLSLSLFIIIVSQLELLFNMNVFSFAIKFCLMLILISGNIIKIIHNKFCNKQNIVNEKFIDIELGKK